MAGRVQCDCLARLAALERQVAANTAIVADWDAVFAAMTPPHVRVRVPRRRTLRALTGGLAAIIVVCGVLSAAAFHSPRHAPAPAWRRTVTWRHDHDRRRIDTVAARSS